jgi:hypothetical protein
MNVKIAKSSGRCLRTNKGGRDAEKVKYVAEV